MERREGKPSASTSSSSLSKETGDLLMRLNESQSMTLHRPFGLDEEGGVSSTISIEYHLTIHFTHSTLSSRELGLLLSVLNYQAVAYGVNFNMILAFYEFYFRLLGNKRNSIELSDSYIRMALTATEIILKEFKDFDWSLWSGEQIQLQSDVKDILRPALISKRTYGSRYQTWRPEKFLRVRIVPVDTLMKRRKDSEPYSSYCKGYGESHPSAHRQHLRPSAEYDGDGSDPYEAEEMKLFRRCTDPILLQSESLLIKYRNLREKS